MSYEQIIYEPGPVARIILNRPEYRNAQSRTLLEELDDALKVADDDAGVKIIVLSGNGTSFSAGHDLGSPPEMADREQRGYPDTRLGRYERSKELFLNMTLRWRNVQKPTLAMVHGYCIFGGWMIASAMDIIFAAEDAMFLPSHFQYFSVPWDLGARKTKELLYENRFIPAPEAMELGLVNRVYPMADLERETLAYAAKVAESDLMGLKMIKFSVNQMLDGMGFTEHVNAAFHTYTMNAGLEQRTGGRTPEGRRRLSGVGRAFARLEAEKGQKQS